MRILISNDDGIYSPGIAVLAQVAAAFGTVRVVAPDVEQSSMGQAITPSRPLAYRATKIDGVAAYRVNGTPADCVALGAHQWDKVDLVLSGLNLGLNLGNAIWHSGTVAAAKQAALLGVRGIALSAPASPETDFTALKPWIHRVLETLVPARELTLVNVNFPRQPRGLVWARASIQQYAGRIVPTRHPSGRELYWFAITPVQEAEQGTDRWAIEQGWIALTPLTLDLTDRAQLERQCTSRPLDETVAAAFSAPTSSPEAADSVRQDEAASANSALIVSDHPDHESEHPDHGR